MARLSRSIRVVVPTLLFLVALSACNTAPAQPQASGGQGGSIKIGYVGPITGQSAYLAEGEMAGQALAVEEINKAGGVLNRKLELAQEDTGGTNAGAVAATTKLIESAGVSAIIGHLRSPNILAASDDIKKFKAPVFTGATAVQVTQQNNPYIFRTRAHDDTQTAVGVEYVVKTLKLDKIAIFHDSDAFGSGGMEGVKKAMAKLNLQPVTVQAWTTGAKDYTAQWLNIKKSGAQAVFIWLADPQDGALIARQKSELGIDVKVVGAGVFTLESTRKAAGQNVEGFYSVTDWSPDLLSPEGKAVAEKYKAKYNKDVDWLGLMSWDQVQLVANAIKTSGSTDKEKIREAAAKTKDLKGALSTYTFDKLQDGVHQALVVQIVKDGIKGIATVPVAVDN